MIQRIRSITELPIALGFGISKPEHVVEAGQWADAVVVGSALVNMISHTADGDLAAEVERYIQWLKSGLN